MAVKSSLPISSIAICPLGLIAFTQISQSLAKSPVTEPVSDQAIANQSQPILKTQTIVIPHQTIPQPQFSKSQPLTKATVAATIFTPASRLLKPIVPLTLPNLQTLLPWERVIARSLGKPVDVIKSSLTQTRTTQPDVLPAPPVVRVSVPPKLPVIASVPAIAVPTVESTLAPTSAPSLEPSIEPSITVPNAIALPVTEPTMEPGIEPTIEPTITPPERSVTLPAETFAPTPFVASATLSPPNNSINPVQTPAPSLTPVVEEAYVLGAGDRVSINILNVPEYSGNYQVLVDGTVNLPVAGAVVVKGLTLQQASEAIVKQYGSELSRFSSVTVNLAASRPLQVAIVGEVGLPGLYTLNNPGGQLPSITQAVQAAGGFTQSANLRQVEIRRSAGQQPQTIKVDLWRLLQGGDQSQNLTLRDGDSIMIPATAGINLSESSQLADSNLGETTAQQVKVALLGEVARPGAYQIESSNTSRLTLTRAVQTAGGITPSADIRQVQIRRFTRDGKEQILTTNLWQLMQSGDLSQDLPLQNGDTITFLKATQPTASETAQLTATNLSASEIQVGLIGELKSPGTLALPANTTLNQALLRGGGFNSRARKSRVELLRMDSSGTLTRRTIELDPKADVNNETNPILQNNDLVVIGPSDRTRITESITNILEPIMRILPPLRFLL